MARPTRLESIDLKHGTVLDQRLSMKTIHRRIRAGTRLYQDQYHRDEPRRPEEFQLGEQDKNNKVSGMLNVYLILGLDVDEGTAVIQYRG